MANKKKSKWFVQKKKLFFLAHSIRFMMMMTKEKRNQFKIDHDELRLMMMVMVTSAKKKKEKKLVTFSNQFYIYFFGVFSFYKWNDIAINHNGLDLIVLWWWWWWWSQIYQKSGKKLIIFSPFFSRFYSH